MSAMVGIVRGPFSDFEKQQAVELAERGLTPAQIAQRMGRHKSSIYYRLLAEGAVRPTLANDPRKPHRRGSHVINPFLPEEDVRIDALSRAGLTPSGIAKELLVDFPDRPRRPGSIRLRLMLKAAQSEAAIEAASP